MFSPTPWGEDITDDQEVKVVVGEIIDLTVVNPDPNVVKYTWFVPGTIVRDESVLYPRPAIDPRTSAGSTPWTSANDKSTVFTWVDAGANRTVQVEMELLSGAKITVSATFNVVGPDPSQVFGAFGDNVRMGPTARLGPVIDAMFLGNGDLIIPPAPLPWAGYPDVFYDGIAIINGAVTPPEAPNGKFFWVQVAERSYWQFNQPDGGHTHVQAYNLWNVLDNWYPYGDPAAGPTPETWVIDSPLQQLAAPFNFERRSDQFRMVLMYNPHSSPGCHSVPVYSMRWRWSCAASLVGGVWTNTATDMNQDILDRGPTVVYPTWHNDWACLFNNGHPQVNYTTP